MTCVRPQLSIPLCMTCVRPQTVGAEFNYCPAASFRASVEASPNWPLHWPQRDVSHLHILLRLRRRASAADRGTFRTFTSFFAFGAVAAHVQSSCDVTPQESERGLWWVENIKRCDRVLKVRFPPVQMLVPVVRAQVECSHSRELRGALPNIFLRGIETAQAYCVFRTPAGPPSPGIPAASWAEQPDR